MAKKRKECWKSSVERVEEVGKFADKFWGQLVKKTGGDEYLMSQAINRLQDKLIRFHLHINRDQLEKCNETNHKDIGD